MCAPLALAAIAVVGTALSVVGQVQQANAQAKAINKQLAVKEKQIDNAAAAEISDRLREARREQARIQVAAGESGLNLQSGAIEGQLIDSSMQATLANERSLANRESRRAEAKAEAQAAMPSKPTLLGAGLQIALSGANAYAGAKSAQGAH